jgi:hypothetical protein
MTTLDQIKAQIEAQVLKSCGSVIEWTFRTAEHFTISGEIVAVNRAVLFCLEHNLARLDGDTVYDAELDETFAYLKAPTAA